MADKLKEALSELQEDLSRCGPQRENVCVSISSLRVVMAAAELAGSVTSSEVGAGGGVPAPQDGEA